MPGAAGLYIVCMIRVWKVPGAHGSLVEAPGSLAGVDKGNLKPVQVGIFNHHQGWGI